MTCEIPSTSILQIILSDDAQTCTWSKLSLNDYKADCSYSVSQAGTYGPVHIRIRASENGQVLAEDTAFAYFTVLPEEPEIEDEGLLTEFLLEFDSDEVKIFQEVKMRFSFELRKEDALNPGDYFVLVFDQDFYVDKEKFDLEWQDGESYTEGVKVVLAEGGRELVFYGFENGIYPGDEGVGLAVVVDGVVCPGYERSAFSFDWRVKVMRYVTPTVVKHARSTGPDKMVSAGEIEVIYWKPINQRLEKMIAQDLNLYTVLALKTQHDMPANSSITITAFKVNMCKYSSQTDSKQTMSAGPGQGRQDECFIYLEHEFGSQLDCIVEDSDDTSIITCSTSSSLQKGVFYLYTLTSIKDTTIFITSIETQNKDSGLIDKLSSIFTSFLKNCEPLTVNQFYVTTGIDDITGINELGVSGKYGLVLSFDAPVGLSKGDSILISGPFSDFTYRTEDFIGFSSNYYGVYEQGTDKQFDSNLAVIDPITFKTNKILIKSGLIEISLQEDLPEGDGIIIFIGAGTLNSNQNILLPLKPFYWKDFQEASVIIQKAATTYIYSKTFLFIENSQDLELTVLPFCNDFLAEGQPISISLNLPYEFTLGTLILYLDFDDSSLIDSTKLGPGDSYPSDNLEFYITSDSKLKAFITGFYPNMPKTFIFPLPIQTTSTTIQLTASLELSLGSTYVKVFSAQDSFTYSSTEKDFDIEDQKDVIGGVTDSITFKLDAGDYDGGDKTSEEARYLYILPNFFTLTTTLSTPIPGAYPNPSYSITLSTKTIFESQENSFSLSVQVPWLESSQDQNLLFAVAIGSKFKDQSCYYSGKRSYTITAPKLVQSKFSPKETKGYTFGSSTTVLEISFSFTGSIYKGSVISFVVGEQWRKISEVVIGKVLFGNEEILGEYEHLEWTSEETLKDFTGGFVLQAVVTLPVVSKEQQKNFEAFKGFEWVRVYYKSEIGSWVSFRWEQSDDDLKDEVYTKFTAGNTTVLASGAEVSVFPDILNTYYAFLAVEFETPFDIPKNSIISIIADFSQDEDLSLNTWCNFEVDSITLEGNNLTITPSSIIPSSSKLRILKDNALTLLSPGFNEVFIILEIDGINVIDDQAKPSSKSGFQVYQTPRNKITSFSITPSIANSGYENLCQITLSISSTIQEKVLIHIKTNKDYNSLAGPVYYSPESPESAYLEGFIESSQKYIKCLTEHWVITCDVGTMFYQKTTGTFSIYLKNPKDVSYFSVYVTNYSNYHLTSPYRQSKYLPDTLTTTFTDHINLSYKSVKVSQSGQIQNILIETRLDLNLTNLSILFITIPKPYDLVLSAKDLGNCSITYHTGKSIYNYPCEVDHSKVVFNLDKSIRASLILSSDYITTFKINGLSDPLIIVSKPKYLYENLRFNSYSLQFLISKAEKLSLSGFSESRIEFESFPNINSAFTGFYSNDLEELVVNAGEPLVVAPGSFTGMFKVDTKDKVLHAKSLKLRGSIRKSKTSERLVLRPDSLELKLDLASQEFMVGCDSSVTSGFYFIDWEIEEDPFYINQFYYRAPRPTLIEIND